MGDSGGDEFRPGDVLRLECPFTETTVTSVCGSYVAVRWPWNEVDPQAQGFGWNGDHALPTPDSYEWDRSYFRTRPAEITLKPGDTCQVGMEPTIVHVTSVHHFDPPMVTGLLPRPACYLEALKQGESHDPDLEDQGYALDPVGGEPISIELLFRPYAFLHVGDEIGDQDGRAWRFDGAWVWHAFDGDRPSTPAWPLTLLFRNGEPPSPEDTAAVAQATETGNHEEELRRWTALTLARPSRVN
ncbi:hypothetical protein BN159_0537 [Streptomyces davaonensis JCM 4913]|uniref:Uncharacterized protein n=1 Tax=Streptomyces davaonensis (strain DSM 101723 / JCM 4913 / KCC S-0913 / 768) TaxID=1214101 RepID=K4QSM6_STRDJ|nr:hypothetical protein [Streptomyces davaonensis]CCK24916.1 hypothetical protein BN159_0537 [Streptomyces davaonensis JCM 4913]